MDIRALRKSLGLSQEAFARRLGVSTSAVVRWENGSRKPGQMARRLINRLERQASRGPRTNN